MEKSEFEGIFESPVAVAQEMEVEGFLSSIVVLRNKFPQKKKFADNFFSFFKVLFDWATIAIKSIGGNFI